MNTYLYYLFRAKLPHASQIGVHAHSHGFLTGEEVNHTDMCAESRIMMNTMNEFQRKCQKEFRFRLSQLRLATGVSAREMSLALGLSESYVNKLENAKTLPSMHTFFAICKYFSITPHDFFNFDEAFPVEIQLAIHELKQLNIEQLERIVGIMHDINRGNH